MESEKTVDSGSPGSQERATPSAGDLPLAVDLDGTLIRSDLLWESFAATMSRKPWLLLLIPFWMLSGRVVLKENLAREGPVDETRLPYREEIVEWLRAERANGREIAIATASNEALAWRVAKHLGFVGRVFATRDNVNLKGEAKRAALVAAYGEGGYDYLGDSTADLPAWRSTRLAHVAGSAALAATVRGEGKPGREFPRTTRVFAPLVRLLRPHQWVKNLLLLVPVVTAHRVADAQSLVHAAYAVASFCLAASAVYVVNDFADLDSDRRHPDKRARPLASGDLSLAWTVLLVPALLAGAALLAAPLPRDFHVALLSYLAATLLYTFSLKRLAVLDVLGLAALYTLRIFAGAAAIGVPLSPWLLGFSMFLFLSLAFIKRYTELAGLADVGSADAAAAGRGYRAQDLPVVGAMGASSGYLAVLVFALFITSADTLVHYRHPAALWAAPCLLLYWITRAWLLTYRREMASDPVAFALTDRPTYAVLAGMLATVFFAT